MVIYLHASLDTLMKRIALRGREFEKMISAEYMEQLSADYHTFIQHFEETHPEIPVLRFNGDEIDFVQNESDLTWILDQVQETLEKRSLQV
jgi:deoxyguanosine kinase